MLVFKLLKGRSLTERPFFIEGNSILFLNKMDIIVNKKEQDHLSLLSFK